MSPCAPARPCGGAAVDVSDYRNVRRRAKAFSKELDKELAKALKQAGRIGVDAVTARHGGGAVLAGASKDVINQAGQSRQGDGGNPQ